MTNYKHTITKALNLGVFHLLPAQHISPQDAALAITATSYACENYYAPKTMSTKVKGVSPLVIQDKLPFPFTKLVLKGIKALYQFETLVGVVLGKDVLYHFNSMLQPQSKYFDLVLVTFD